MKLSHLTMIAFLAGAVAAPAFAQPGPGMGGGMGPGKGARYSLNKDNTPGWALMTPEERAANQQKMWSFKSYDDCKAYQAQHHKDMEARAKEQGKTLVAPRYNACERMQARGMFK